MKIRDARHFFLHQRMNPLKPTLVALLVIIMAAFASAELGEPLAVERASAEEGAAALTVDGRAAEPITILTSQGRHAFTVEIADDPAERAQGLMHRQSMPPDHGMLFDFGTPRPVQMWMKDTPLSLDMIFIDPQGTVVSIAERTTPFSPAIIASDGPVSHVLEVKAGIARLIGLKPGDRIEHRLFEQR